MGIIYALKTENTSSLSIGNQINFQSSFSWKKAQSQVQSEGLQVLSAELARRVLVEAMEQEADELCGGRSGRHLGDDRLASRHGRKLCKVPFGAARMEIKRPRVRANGKELQLSTYLAAKERELSPQTVLATCVNGTSQRGFPKVAQTLQGTERPEFSHRSKSTVNRYFIRAAKKVLKDLQERSLAGARYLALYIDGVQEQGYHALAVLGLTIDGEKRVLGLREGTSESSEVCRELLVDLLRRGLEIGDRFVAVIDGGKGLSSALREVFGSQVKIQRCRAHKIRNVLEKLPVEERESAKKEINRAWSEPDFQNAERMLNNIAFRLKARGRVEASNSLKEGLRETLTCNSLKLPADSPLTRFLATTNPLESLFARHDDVSRRVCRWRSGTMLLRWVGTSLALAENSFTRVEDGTGLALLATALNLQPSPALPAAS